MIGASARDAFGAVRFRPIPRFFIRVVSRPHNAGWR